MSGRLYKSNVLLYDHQTESLWSQLMEKAIAGPLSGKSLKRLASINKPAWSTPEAEANLLRLIPCNRIGDPQDIAAVAVWLASDESDYVQGTTIFVDGGMTLYPGFATGG